jgi:superfamily II DNA or RNA helicase
MDNRRLFTSVQRRELFVSACGKCQECGVDLPDDWEAHHKEMHARGGLTELDNGEALCSECHRKRHARKVGAFEKDYSWQEQSISHFMNNSRQFYSEARGQFERAYINEVSPSGGKTIFSMKLAARMIDAGLIDKVIWCVPRENIKDGFRDDARFVEVASENQLLNSKFIRVDDDLNSTYRGRLRNYHGAVITYHALRGMYDYLGLLAEAYRLMFVFDEAHHGATGEEDDAMNVWGGEMERCRTIARAIVCMTGTPLRSDLKRIPFVRYKEIEGSDGRRGYQVEPDFSFSYQNAVAAGIARKLICRSQDPDVTYIIENEGEIEHFKYPVSAIPSSHLPWVKNVAFRFDEQGIVDDMLKIAHEECGRLRRTGDPDAAILVIGRRDISGGDNSLSEISKRISVLFSDDAITVESADGPISRDRIRAFKKGTSKWIVAKEMISEGTNIPRLRVVVILRDIGNRTFYEQLVHRVTRNDADDRPQDAFIIQLQLPNLHEWGLDLERQALIGWEKQKRKGGPGGELPPGPSSKYIAGISADLETEVVVMEGEDFTNQDPIGRVIHEEIGMATKLSRWQINKVLKSAAGKTDATASHGVADETFTIEEQCSRYLDLGKRRCKSAAINYGGGSLAFKRVFAECKKSAGIRCKLDHLLKDHPNPLAAAQAFLKAANRTYERSKSMSETSDSKKTEVMI